MNWTHAFIEGLDFLKRDLPLNRTNAQMAMLHIIEMAISIFKQQK